MLSVKIGNLFVNVELPVDDVSNAVAVYLSIVASSFELLVACASVNCLVNALLSVVVAALPFDMPSSLNHPPASCSKSVFVSTQNLDNDRKLGRGGVIQWSEGIAQG